MHNIPQISVIIPLYNEEQNLPVLYRELVTVLKDLYNKYSEGYDIVNTRRINTMCIGFFKKTTSRMYYKLINLLSDSKIEPFSSDFRLMNRKATEAFISFQERNRFTRGLVSWMGFRQAVIDFEAPRRYTGKTKYTFRKMFSTGLDGITAFSSKPLRISFYTGLLIFLAGIIYAVFVVINSFRGMNIPGWTSTICHVFLSESISGKCIVKVSTFCSQTHHQTAFEYAWQNFSQCLKSDFSGLCLGHDKIRFFELIQSLLLFLHTKIQVFRKLFWDSVYDIQNRVYQ